MATTQDALRGNVVGTAERAAPIGGVRFDWTMVVVTAWLIGGLFIDGWAHNHRQVDTSFFTPWHAVFYSGYLACAVALVGAMLLNRSRGYSWGRALPAGYELSLAGIAIFGAGGVGDLVWHTLFGIEVSTEALLSPTHLMLATGMALIASGPIRAFWKRPTRKSEITLRSYLPLILSVLLFYSLFTFMMQFAHPFVNSWTIEGTRRPGGDADLRMVATIIGMITQAGLFTGLILMLIRRWTLPLGTFTLIFALNTLMMATQKDQWRFVPVGLITGAVVDFLLWRFKPSSVQRNAHRLFSFAVPVIFYGLYFLVLWQTTGMWWSIHMWGGSLVLVGVAGLLLSYLVVPPMMPADEA
jgi:hypothetical protein